jgi:hypothetical protein
MNYTMNINSTTGDNNHSFNTINSNNNNNKFSRKRAREFSTLTTSLQHENRKIQRVWVSADNLLSTNSRDAIGSKANTNAAVCVSPVSNFNTGAELLLKQVLPILLEMDRQLCRSYQQQLNELQQWQADVFSQLYREQSAPPDSSYLC